MPSRRSGWKRSTTAIAGQRTRFSSSAASDAGALLPAEAGPFEGGAEGGAVPEVDREPDRGPGASAGRGAAEQADVGVRRPEHPLEHRLGGGPRAGGDDSCDRAPLSMGRAGIEPATLGLKVPCSTN